MGLDIENICYNRVKSSNDALQFNENFEKSRLTNDIFVKGIKELNVADYPNYLSNFKGEMDTLKQKAKEIYVSSYPKTVKQASDAGRLYPEFSKLADDKAFAIVYNEETDDNFENYLKLFNNKERQDYVIMRYVAKVGKNLSDFNSSSNELGLYNLHKQYSNSYSNLIRELADVSMNFYNKINDNKYPAFEKAAKRTDGYTLVKVIFKTNNGEPAIKKIESVVNMMKNHHIKSYDIGNLIGITNPDKGSVFTSIDDINTYYDNGVINASWYRAGTQKTGEMLELKFNSGFPAFEKAINTFAGNNEIVLKYCDYLGSFSADQRMQAEREQARVNYQKAQCAKCEIDWKKTENPSNVEHWLFGNVHKQGKIVMKNGEEYEFDITNGKLWISTGWFSSKEFDTYQEMLGEFLEKCQEKYCNY